MPLIQIFWISFVARDFLPDFKRLAAKRVVPFGGPDGKEGKEYRHHRTGEDNGDAHLKRQLLGQQVTMPVSNGRLHLGNWEQIHYAEFDGKRRKRILVKVVGVIPEVKPSASSATDGVE